MKSFLLLLAAGLLTLSASNSLAQTGQNLLTNNLLLIGPGGTLTLSYSGTGPSSLTIPSGSTTLVPTGGSINQMLRWDGTEWLSDGTLLNDGTDITIPTGDLTVTLGVLTGNGSGLTNLDAGSLATGTIDDGLLSLNVALLDADNTFDGYNTFNQSVLVAGEDPTSMFQVINTDIASGSAALFANTDVDNYSPVISAVTLGLCDGGEFLILNPDNPDAALYGGSGGNDLGTGVFGEHLNDGVGVRGISSAGISGSFETYDAGNTNPALFAYTEADGPAAAVVIANTANTFAALEVTSEGEGSAGDFAIDNTSNIESALLATTNGEGSAGEFRIANVTNTGNALYATTNGATPGASIFGESTSDAYGVRGSSVDGIGVSAESANNVAGRFDITNASNNNRVLEVETAGGGGGIYAEAPSGIAIEAASSTNNGISTSSVDGNAIFARSTNSTAGSFYNADAGNTSEVLRVQHNGIGPGGAFYLTNASTNQSTITAYNAGSGVGVQSNTESGSAIEGSSTSGTGGRFSGAIGVEITAGGIVGPISAFSDGATLTANIVTAFVEDNATGANDVTVSVPATGAQGQIIYVITDDPDGITIGSVTATVDESLRLFYYNGAWKVTK